MPLEHINMASILQFESIYFGYHPEQFILRELSFDLKSDEIVSILGPSGSGKSTLLRLMAGLEKPFMGKMEPSEDARKKKPVELSLLFQNPVLLPHLNVRENLAIGWRLRYNSFVRLWWGRREPSELRQRLDEVVELLQLQNVQKQWPHSLSGGQRQRVALGRCLVRRPVVFLLDEPLASLDQALAETLRKRLRELFQSWHSTAVWVTHDLEEARAVADRCLKLERGKLV